MTQLLILLAFSVYSLVLNAPAFSPAENLIVIDVELLGAALVSGHNLNIAIITIVTRNNNITIRCFLFITSPSIFRLIFDNYSL